MLEFLLIFWFDENIGEPKSNKFEKNYRVINRKRNIIFTYCGPRIFCYYTFPTQKAKLVSYFEKSFLENGLESLPIFVLF